MIVKDDNGFPDFLTFSEAKNRCPKGWRLPEVGEKLSKFTALYNRAGFLLSDNLNERWDYERVYCWASDGSAKIFDPERSEWRSDWIYKGARMFVIYVPE